MSYPPPRYEGEGLVLSDEEKTKFFLRHDTYWT
jgi:hypothetical protein